MGSIVILFGLGYFRSKNEGYRDGSKCKRCVDVVEIWFFKVYILENFFKSFIYKGNIKELYSRRYVECVVWS